MCGFVCAISQSDKGHPGNESCELQERYVDVRMATSVDSALIKTQTFHHLLDENSCRVLVATVYVWCFLDPL